MLKPYKNKCFKAGGYHGVAIVAQQITNPTSMHEDEGLIPGLVGGLRIQHCCELWCRSQMQLGSRHCCGHCWALLWCRLAAAAPVQPLAWKLPYAMGAALKRKKKKEINKTGGYKWGEGEGGAR